MADKIRLLMESMLPDMLYYLKRDVFNKEETREIMHQRENNEYLILRKNYNVKEILKSINYEYDLERRRRKAYSNKKIKKENEKDFQIIKRIIQLWDKATQKFRYDIELWKQYLSFCYYIRSKRLFFKAVSAALRFNSHNTDLWLLAANYEFEVNRNPFKARKVFYKALKLNNKKQDLWLEYFRFEMKFYEMILQRNEILNIGKEEEEEDKEEQLQDDFIGFEEEGHKIAALEKQQNSQTASQSIDIFKTIFNLGCQYLSPLEVGKDFIAEISNSKIEQLKELKKFIKAQILENSSNFDQKNSTPQQKIKFLAQIYELYKYEKNEQQQQDGEQKIIINLEDFEKNSIDLLEENKSILNLNDFSEFLDQFLIDNQVDNLSEKMPVLVKYIQDNFVHKLIQNKDYQYDQNKQESLVNLIIQYPQEFRNKEIIQQFEEIAQNVENSKKVDWILNLSKILEPKQASQQIFENLNMGIRFTKEERQALLERVLEIVEKSEKKMNEILNYTMKNLVNFKVELEGFLVKFFRFLNDNSNNFNKNFVEKCYVKCMSYNSNCPLAVYLDAIQNQYDWEEMHEQRKVEILIKKLINWYTKEQKLWEVYFKFAKKTNPTQCPNLLELAAKSSGMKYQDLQVMYNKIVYQEEEQ